MINTQSLLAFIEREWADSIIPTLETYIRIPNKSPLFDPDWQIKGHMDRAVACLVDWCQAQKVEGMILRVERLPGRTPLIFIEIKGKTPETILLYGHLDKQPEMVGWTAPFSPWEPVIQDDKLYGRGGADDGYAIFASLLAIKALQVQKLPHPRCVLIIEACEESGSTDLPAYIEYLAPEIGKPKLVICLDSGCGNYEQLWSTTSLRGMVSGTLSVSLLKEGVHSGNGSGIIASSFRVMRALLSRLEDEETGKMRLSALHAPIPPERTAQAEFAAKILEEEVYDSFPLQSGVRPVSADIVELILNRTWRPSLSVIGVGGIPSLDNAGSVLRPQTQVKLSFRLPPTVDAEIAALAIKDCLEANAPYGAVVAFSPEKVATGWEAPALAPWLAESIERASELYFGQPPVYMGEGGTIPFMGMLGQRFPKAQFLITGVLGPHSNAHGPNEFLHLPTAKRLTACIAEVIARI